MMHLKRLALPLLFALYLSLALAGVFYNYPLSTTIGDETVLMAASLKMLATHSLRPDFPTNYHMPLGAYLYLPFFAPILLFLRVSGLFTSVASLKEFGILEYGKLLPFARLISVLFGLACLYLLYKICRKLFNDSFAALIAAFLLATDAWFVFLSHFGKVWVPQLFTILLALYAIVAFHRASTIRLRHYLAIGALTAAAFATHVVGVVVYLPFLVAQQYKNVGRGWKSAFVTNKGFWAGNAVIVLLVAFSYYLNPYGFQNYFHQSSAAAQGIGSTSVSETNYAQGFFFYLRVLLEYAPLLLVASLYGAWKLWRRARDVFWLLVSFIVGYYLLIGPFLGSTHAQPHYIAPLTPVLAIIAAYGLAALWRERLATRHKAVKVACLFAFVATSLYLPVLFDYRLAQETTQQQFLRWLYATVPAGAKIVEFDAYLPINENRASIELTKRLNPGFLQQRQSALLGLPDSAYPSPNYFVFLPLYPDGIPKEIDRRQFEYAVLTWQNENDHRASIEEAREFGVTEEKRLITFPEDGIAHTYSADPENLRTPILNLVLMRHTGPIVAVYKLR